MAYNQHQRKITELSPDLWPNAGKLYICKYIYMLVLENAFYIMVIIIISQIILA